MEFLSPVGMKAISEAVNKYLLLNNRASNAASLEVVELNTYKSIRSLMDRLLHLIDLHLDLNEPSGKKGLSIKQKIYLEKAFLVAFKAYEMMDEAVRIRSDGRLFIYHPLEVAIYAIEHLCITDVEIIAGILLHDTVEYSYITCEFLKDEFSVKVADIVYDLGQNRKIQKREWSQTISEIKNNLELQTFLDKIQLKTPGIFHENKDVIVSLTMKKEHYKRLIQNSRSSISPLIKIIDNIHIYSTESVLSNEQKKNRHPLEFVLFKDFIEKCNNTFRIPNYVLEEALRYINRNLNVSITPPIRRGYKKEIISKI